MKKALEFSEHALLNRDNLVEFEGHDPVSFEAYEVWQEEGNGDNWVAMGRYIFYDENEEEYKEKEGLLYFTIERRRGDDDPKYSAPYINPEFAEDVFGAPWEDYEFDYEEDEDEDEPN